MPNQQGEETMVQMTQLHPVPTEAWKPKNPGAPKQSASAGRGWADGAYTPLFSSDEINPKPKPPAQQQQWKPRPIAPGAEVATPLNL